MQWKRASTLLFVQGLGFAELSRASGMVCGGFYGDQFLCFLLRIMWRGAASCLFRSCLEANLGLMQFRVQDVGLDWGPGSSQNWCPCSLYRLWKTYRNP